MEIPRKDAYLDLSIESTFVNAASSAIMVSEKLLQDIMLLELWVKAHSDEKHDFPHRHTLVEIKRWWMYLGVIRAELYERSALSRKDFVTAALHGRSAWSRCFTTSTILGTNPTFVFWDDYVRRTVRSAIPHSYASMAEGRHVGWEGEFVGRVVGTKNQAGG